MRRHRSLSKALQKTMKHYVNGQLQLSRACGEFGDLFTQSAQYAQNYDRQQFLTLAQSFFEQFHAIQQSQPNVEAVMDSLTFDHEAALMGEIHK